MPTYRKTVSFGERRVFFVPVVNQSNQPLMPTTILRARRWIDSGRATPFYKKGIFCVRLNVAPSNNQKQEKPTLSNQSLILILMS